MYICIYRCFAMQIKTIFEGGNEAVESFIGSIPMVSSGELTYLNFAILYGKFGFTCE